MSCTIAHRANAAPTSVASNHCLAKSTVEGIGKNHSGRRITVAASKNDCPRSSNRTITEGDDPESAAEKAGAVDDSFLRAGIKQYSDEPRVRVKLLNMDTKLFHVG